MTISLPNVSEGFAMEHENTKGTLKTMNNNNEAAKVANDKYEVVGV